MSAAPPAFNPRTSFSTLAQQPITTTGLPGSQLDGEFSRAADSINQIKSRLSEVQRDDGKLRNGVVSTESLSEDVKNLFIASGTKPVTWAVGAPFAVGDFVSNPPGTPGTYLCITAHTSSSLFVSDLTKWALIAAPPTVGFLYTNTFTGNGTTTVFNLTQAPATIDNTQLFIDGIYQPKSGYSISGQLLTITPAPASGSDIEISIGVPSDTTTVTVTDGAISTAKIETAAVTTPKIAPFAVTNDKLADGAVSSEKILSSAVSTAKLENNAVTNAKIAQDSITSDKIAAESITNAKLAPLSVSTDNIANGNITQAKLAPNVTTTGPAFHVNMGDTNQFVPNTGINQTIQFDNEVFDIGSCFNTSNYRFTPNVAGYYQINLAVQLDNNNSGSLGNTFSAIRKNGNLYYDVGITSMGATAFQLSSMLMSGSVLLYMNGTTDYIEASAAISFGTTTNAVIYGSYARTYMSGFLARSA
jgi:hypothetical protein